MLYISNIEFVEKYLLDKNNVDKILSFFDIVKFLSKKYGKKLRTETFLNKIQQIDNDLCDFIKILNIWWKLEKKKISDLQRIIKDKMVDYTKSYEIVSKNSKSIEPVIVERLKNISWTVNVWLTDSTQIGLAVKWEWMYYNRTLENDLDKLLN